MTAQAAVDAPRLHLDGDEMYAEPGLAAELAATGLPVTTSARRTSSSVAARPSPATR